MTYILAYDIGTTGVKTCLFEVEKTIKLIAAASDAEYIELYIYANEVHLRKKNKAQCGRAMSVPLLKKVEG